MSVLLSVIPRLRARLSPVSGSIDKRAENIFAIDSVSPSPAELLTTSTSSGAGFSAATASRHSSRSSERLRVQQQQ